MPPIKLYWCARLVRGRKNFGDWMSPELVRHLSGREVEYAAAGRADLVAVGSVLHRIPTHWWNKRVDVWGTGLMYDKPARAKHRYHALRGKLTEQLLGATDVKAYGDPGLLVALLLPRFAEVPKRWDVGLVPHHSDQTHAGVEALRARVPGVRVLDILSGTQEFLTELAACRFVLSSSLHGLVSADAFGIPNAWITISDEMRGGAFKFGDYYSVFGINNPVARPIDDVKVGFIEETRSAYRRSGLDEIKANLVRAFPYPR
jgi:pyruvyltransferase